MAASILAIEYLCAVQGSELREPLYTSSRLQAAVNMLRQQVPHYNQDRLQALDIQKAKHFVQLSVFCSYVDPAIFSK